jgi:hypothetical protein
MLGGGRVARGDDSRRPQSLSGRRWSGSEWCGQGIGCETLEGLYGLSTGSVRQLGVGVEGLAILPMQTQRSNQKRRCFGLVVVVVAAMIEAAGIWALVVVSVVPVSRSVSRSSKNGLFLKMPLALVCLIESE